MVGTETLIGYLDMSTASVERGLSAQRQPGPSGKPDLTSRRPTLPGGRGTSAVRGVEPASRRESYVWVPVAAAEGRKAGQPIGADAAGAVMDMDEVEAAGWLTVQRRAGAYGRHVLITHDIAPEAATAGGVPVPDSSVSEDQEHG